MAAVPSSLPPSLASEYQPGNAWLTQDTSNPTGKGPVTTGPSENISDPANGTAPVSLPPSQLPWQESELAEAPPDYFAESAFPHAGPWPALPDEPTGKEPFGTLPPDGITAAGSYKVPPKITGLAQTRALLPGHDAHSQLTDTAGWDQYTPSGRTAARQGWHQDYPGVDNFWPVTQPNLARTRTARGADQEIHGTVAQYGDLANSGGNTAYEPPAPPAVTTQQAAAGGAGSIPQWGF
jgi:hypothetical protein